MYASIEGAKQLQRPVPDSVNTTISDAKQPPRPAPVQKNFDIADSMFAGNRRAVPKSRGSMKSSNTS